MFNFVVSVFIIKDNNNDKIVSTTMLLRLAYDWKSNGLLLHECYSLNVS